MRIADLMRKHLLIALCLTAMAVFLSGEISLHAAKKAVPARNAKAKVVKTTPKGKKAAAAPTPKARAKKAVQTKKAISTDTALSRKEPVLKEEPPAAISPASIDALAAGDVSGALLALREEKDSPKVFYLLRETTRILDYRTRKKPDKTDAHKIYQNVGVAYHNLYLLLKARGIDQPLYAKEAERFYRKARGAGTHFHRAECDLLQSALLAASGEREKADRLYMKIDESALRGDFESMEYLAAFHAAMGNVEGTIAALDAAHRLNPDATLTWLAVGDDFANIASDPQFSALLVTWKAREASRQLTLSLPRSEKPRFQVTDETGLFRPQKAMPHYNLKKSGKGKKSAAVASGKKETGTRKKNAAATKSSKKKKSTATTVAKKKAPSKKSKR